MEFFSASASQGRLNSANDADAGSQAVNTAELLSILIGNAQVLHHIYSRMG